MSEGHFTGLSVSHVKSLRALCSLASGMAAVVCSDHSPACGLSLDSQQDVPGSHSIQGCFLSSVSFCDLIYSSSCNTSPRRQVLLQSACEILRVNEGSVKIHGFFLFVLQLPVLLRIGCVGLVFACNAVMWTVFAKALRLSSSSAAASVTMTASNFICSVSRSLPQALKPGGAQHCGNGHTGCDWS